MARQVLENGVILPAEYSDDWYDDMTSNLTKLDDVIGSDSEKLSSADVGAAALSNNYNDLDNLPTIPTVNDATLTIQKNGVNVQTFTANASSNVTANITVPTKTSDLTNDSNFVDTSNSAVASGITSAKVTSYDSHIADNDIHVTTADKSTWNTVTSKANDSDVVHKSGDETIGGQKTFSHGQTGVGRDIFHLTPIPYGKNTPPANTSYQYIWFTGNSASQGLTNNWYGGYLEQLVGTDGSARGRWLVRRTDERVASVEILASADNTLTFRPTNGNVMQLGDSSRPWKDCKTSAINGLNPSSLGMPDLSNGIDISSYITVVANGSKESLYTPTVNGWVSVALTRTGGSNMAVMLKQGNFASSGHKIAQENGTTTCNAMLPVKGGVQVSINSALADGIAFAYFYPCLGNV